MVASTRKPPRPSIDNPRLGVKMKSSTSNKRAKNDSNILGTVGRLSRRKPQLGQVVSSTVRSNKAPDNGLSVSWIDSLRDFKFTGPGGNKTAATRKSPRLNYLTTKISPNRFKPKQTPMVVTSNIQTLHPVMNHINSTPATMSKNFQTPSSIKEISNNNIKTSGLGVRTREASENSLTLDQVQD